MEASIKRVNEKEYHSLYVIAEFRVNLKMSLSYPHMIHDFHFYQSQMDAERWQQIIQNWNKWHP